MPLAFTQEDFLVRIVDSLSFAFFTIFHCNILSLELKLGEGPGIGLGTKGYHARPGIRPEPLFPIVLVQIQVPVPPLFPCSVNVPWGSRRGCHACLFGG